MEAEKLQDQVVELRNSLAQLREDLTSSQETQRLHSEGDNTVAELQDQLGQARAASLEREAELARQTAAAQGDVMAERARSEETDRLRVEKTMEAEKLQDQVVELRNSLAQLRE